MRKLASIQLITELRDIPGATNIEVARVLGWWVVVKKNEFAVGSKTVYVEIDSVLPEKPEFEFMRTKKFKVKTIKLRGQVSQGICFPVTILPKSLQTSAVDTDVTDALGIKKWEPHQKESKVPRLLAQFKKKTGLPWPSHLVFKTDETRVQILEPLLNKYKGTSGWYVAEKMDGSSFTAYLHNGKFGVCSRNLELAPPGDGWFEKLVTKFKLRKKIKTLEYKWTVFMDKYNPKWTGIVRQKVFNPLLELVDIDAGVDDNYWSLAKELDLESKMRSTGLTSFAIQGEMCGPGIQGNKYGFDKKRLFLFQMLDTGNKSYMSLLDLETYAGRMGLEVVPILERNWTLDHSVDDLVAMAEGKSIFNKKTEREGLVFRKETMVSDYELADLNASLVSFKAISPKFLLKNDE